MKVSSHAKSSRGCNLSSEIPPTQSLEFSQKPNSHHQKKSVETVCNWNCYKTQSKLKHLEYGITQNIKAQRIMNTNQKFRSIIAFKYFHLISSTIMSSNSLVANWIWVSIFSLQSIQCKNAISQKRKTNLYMVVCRNSSKINPVLTCISLLYIFLRIHHRSFNTSFFFFWETQYPEITYYCN